jgi:MHS family proline/betaine transporter-like MFS transporter
MMHEAQRRRRAIVAGVIGNALEWYDFAIYAFFAPTIAQLFFPAGDEAVSLLAALAAFGAGFLMRPIGAVVLGGYADRAGRKAALMATMLLMGVGTTIIGIAPTYQSIGWWAPLLVVVARLIQGFSAGGEIGGSTAFLLEHAVPNRRGLTASWQQSSQAATLLLGSLIGAAIDGLLSAEDLKNWGWRLPFLLGIVIVPAGLYIRRHVDETPAFCELDASRELSPLFQLVRRNGRELVSGLGLVVVWTVSMYFFLVYMPTYAVREMGLTQSGSLIANGIALAVLTVLAPIFGRLSDGVGRRPVLLTGACGLCALSFPAIVELSIRPSLHVLIVVQVVIAGLIAMVSGPAPAALAELYPTRVRSSGVALAYNGAVTIFGGFAPFISTWLIAKTGNKLAPAYYVVSAALLSVIALVFMRERASSMGSAVAAAQRAGVSPKARLNIRDM